MTTDSNVPDVFQDILSQAQQMPDPSAGPTLTNTDEMDPKLERMLRMCAVAGKFSSTLALKPIRAEIVDDPNLEAPAWSDAENIWFNANKLGELSDPEVVVSIKGLILHETAHIMLTPRTGSGLVKDIKAKDLWRAFNALEDMRIETFMTARFSNVDDWLMATIAQHLLSHPKMYSVAFPILVGRRYLPQAVRNEVRRLYEKPKDIPEITSLVDEYIQMNLGDSKNYTRALEIITRFNELVDSIQNQNPNEPWSPSGWNRIPDPNSHEHRGEGEYKSSSNKPMNKGDQDKVIARVQRSMANDASDEPSDSDGEDGKSYAPPTNATNDGDTEGDGASGSSDGQSVLQDLLKKQVDDVLKRKSKEIQNNIKQFTGEVELNGKPMKAPKRAASWDYAASPEAVQAVKSFARELTLLRAEHDPGWDRRTEQGKLNVQRYATGCEVDEAFDEWNLGREDAVDIECYIALDTSPSMGSMMQGAYESMWAIKRSMDKIGASTTVVNFSSVTELLYSSDERAGHKYRYGGMGSSTEPLKSIQYGRSVLANSKRAIKIFIAITDGWWYEDAPANDIIRHLRKAGVITALAYISGKDWNGNVMKPNEIDSHGCEVAVNVTDMPDLFKLAKGMVKAGIARNLSK
jgi:hypothetical protein